MLSVIRENIKSFLDVTVFITMIAVGVFALVSDYRYFKKMKFKKDAASALVLGLACILMPFVLLLVSRL